MNAINRRNFLRTSVMGGVAVSFLSSSNALASVKKIVSPVKDSSFASSVALTTGDNRADLAFRALQPYSKQIRQAIGNRRVVLKPNNVSTSIQLSSTHVDTLEGVLEFLKSIDKLDNVIIAESAADGPSMDGFSNYGYMRLANKYPVKFVDLDNEGFEVLHVFDEKDFRPHPVRFSSILLNPDSYIVSVARMKTHDRTLATLSLKNIVFGAPIKDPGFSWGPNHKEGLKTDKPIVHGGGFRGINFNMYELAPRLHPHLALIDGYEGMEGNGPTEGTPVDHRVCVASTDWLAADRVAIELMGIDFANVGYLNYCYQTGQGMADLTKIEIIGEKINNHIKHYRMADNIEKQLIWLKPASI
jgi:uncharacterized protein (DUF362 family)